MLAALLEIFAFRVFIRRVMGMTVCATCYVEPLLLKVIVVTILLPFIVYIVVLQVDVLSGGEKARLALAKFMLTKGTFLVLDEPTNHLDIPSKEMLEEALMKFKGAVIAVSHDRYFLRKISTRVVTVSAACLWPLQLMIVIILTFTLCSIG